jgi:starch phosphorylase
LTIGTMDGANIEIYDAVGAENFFMFGLRAAEAATLQRSGYRPYECYQSNPELREVIDLLRSGFFSRGNAEQFRPLIDNLLHHDPYLVLADYQAYADCQQQISSAWLDSEHWTRMSILNVARSGRFSSDRTIREYCQDIWRVAAVPVRLISQEEIQAGLVQ